MSLTVFSEWESMWTHYGWLLNNFIAELLFSSGIVLIAIVAALFSTRRVTTVTSELADIAQAQKKLEIKAAIVVVVLLFAFFPMFKISEITVLNMQSHCEHQSNRAQTPFVSDQVKQELRSLSDLRIPVLWAFLHKLGSGIIYQIAASLDCFTDWTDIETVVRTNKIRDPALIHEYSLFVSKCYRQARYHYQTQGLSSHTNLPPSDDLGYIGSHYYLNTRGYYRDFLLPTRLARWQPNWVRSCYAWWQGEDSNEGLKSVLFNQAIEQLSAAEVNAISSRGGARYQDAVIEAMLKSNPPDWHNIGTVGSQHMNHSVFSHGDISEQISFALSQSYFLKQLAMYAQPILLLALYFLVPLLLLTSRLNLAGVLRYLAYFFSIQAIPLLYLLTTALDAQVIDNLYDGLSLENTDFKRLMTAYTFTYFPIALFGLVFLSLIQIAKKSDI